MTPDEVLEKLKSLGIEVTERTLQRYVKDELIPMPERKSGGRGKGRSTDYKEETPAEFYASHRLRFEYGLKADIIARCRKRAVDNDLGFSLEASPEYLIEIGFAKLWLSKVEEVNTLE